MLRDKTALILSGGYSSRMGRNKALLMLGGRSLVEVMLDKTVGFGERLLVVNDTDAYDRLRKPDEAAPVRIIEDILPRQGPMSGIHAGICRAENEYVVVLPCDMPLFPKEALLRLAELARTPFDVVVPFADGRPQPLCAAYGKTCAAVMEESLKAGRNKLSALFERNDLRVRRVSARELFGSDDADALFMNVNDPAAYEALRVRVEAAEALPRPRVLGFY